MTKITGHLTSDRTLIYYDEHLFDVVVLGVRSIEKAGNEVTSREVLATGLGYLEGARWFDGALWFSDIQQKTVNKMTPSGDITVVATLDPRPSGIGFEADGTPLVISMEDSRLVRLTGGEVVPIADFAARSNFINDMAVTPEGRAYITQFGYDLFGGEKPTATGILVRHPDGSIEEAGAGLTFPNGVVVSADGRLLVVAESFGVPRTKLTAFDIGDDGSLGNQRVFAEFGTPDLDVIDGICIDTENGVWVAFCKGEFRRVLDGGEITDVIEVPADGGNYCVDCALGGEDLRSLYLLIADTTVERLGNNWDSSARIEVAKVKVPAAL